GVSVAQPDWQGKLANWIAQHPNRWWQGVWVACEIKGDPGEIEPATVQPGAGPAEIFANARLNIAENLLGYGPRSLHALSAWAEDGPRQSWSRGQVKEMAGRFASGFASMGLQSGDNIILNLPDVPEKLAAFLGASWLGLVSVLDPPWSQPTTDIITDWQQINPKLIVTCDGYRRHDKWIDRADIVELLLQKFAGQAAIIPVPCAGSRSPVQDLEGVFNWRRFEQMGHGGGHSFTYVGFAHELAKVRASDADGFTSVQSGPWLLEQMAKWQLLLDPEVDSHIFAPDFGVQSDWLFGISALVTGSDILLYDGAETAMNGQVLWRMMQREQCKIIAANPGLIANLQTNKQKIPDDHNLDPVQRVFVEQSTAQVDRQLLLDLCFTDARIVPHGPFAG
ncbi:hypothetical protein MNBD_ALPHA06-1464, partial [hydrothermal vent metagenome]